MLIKSDAKNQYGSTALMRASINGHKEVVEMLNNNKRLVSYSCILS
ncbi:ankyrin repeat domain-containing protein [Candidatus Babela massiliensis]|uniref:Ankyrin repeats containing protein n=1 Tax=Candidatus Babela massiliensis TaxID=673862 RepID=V6DF37_9BACT|nr:ankyrin repeat domain-containing protein [Candidatus Babela massiliensis]CDK30212.1 Ankyrin repeats containing protein [Candidatus Babela massiliensis]